MLLAILDVTEDRSAPAICATLTLSRIFFSAGGSRCVAKQWTTHMVLWSRAEGATTRVIRGEAPGSCSNRAAQTARCHLRVTDASTRCFIADLDAWGVWVHRFRLESFMHARSPSPLRAANTLLGPLPFKVASRKMAGTLRGVGRIRATATPRRCDTRRHTACVDSLGLTNTFRPADMAAAADST